MKKNVKKKKLNFMRIFMTIFLIYTVVTVLNQQIKIEQSKDKNEALAKEIEEIQRENQRLKVILDNANTPEYQEKAAREQLGMVKPGETVYINQPAENASTDGVEDRPEADPAQDSTDKAADASAEDTSSKEGHKQ